MAPAVSLRAATAADLPDLARMNRELIEDERSPNPMSLAQLQARMQGWLAGEYQVEFFEAEGSVVGYAAYRLRPDGLFPGATVAYVRQFFIARASRGLGLGRRAFERLAGERFPPGCLIEVDVLTLNPGGQRFWERLGFAPYYINLRRQSDSP